LDNPGTDRDKRINLIDKMCYKIDGLSSHRIADRIVRLLRTVAVLGVKDS